MLNLTSNTNCFIPIQNASEWPHYVHEEFQAAATKEQLEKVNVFIFFIYFLATAGPVSPYLGVYSICSYCTVQHSCQLPEWSPLFYDGHPSKCNKHGPSSIPKNHPVWPHARLGGVNTNYSTYFFVIFESSHIAANKLYFLKFQKIQNFDCALSAKIQF